jgi:hypothetical protein
MKKQLAAVLLLLLLLASTAIAKDKIKDTDYPEHFTIVQEAGDSLYCSMLLRDGEYYYAVDEDVRVAFWGKAVCFGPGQTIPGRFPKLGGVDLLVLYKGKKQVRHYAIYQVTKPE